MHLLGQPQLRPVPQPPPDGAIRAARRGDPSVTQAVDLGGDHAPEDPAIGDALAMTAQGMRGHDAWAWGSKAANWTQSRSSREAGRTGMAAPRSWRWVLADRLRPACSLASPCCRSLLNTGLIILGADAYW